MTTAGEREKPKRIRLSRARGFRLPDNAVNVARPGKWGNPFVVGQDGDREYCVELYKRLLCGYMCLSCKATMPAQDRTRGVVIQCLQEIRGKDLACWCALDGKPCHADVLLEIANATVEVQP